LSGLIREQCRLALAAWDFVLGNEVDRTRGKAVQTRLARVEILKAIVYDAALTGVGA
jgi:hypothetical protein